MKKGLLVTALPTLLLVVVLVVAAYLIGQHQGWKNAIAVGRTSPTGQPTGDGPTATVRTATIRQGAIAQQLKAFGIVKTQQGDISFISVPLESRINRLFVTPGQRVAKDQMLFELELSPAQQIAIAEARINATTATAQLKQVEQRKSEMLATNQELSQAQQTASLAQARYDQLVQQKEQTLERHTAGFSGVVSKIDTQPGQVVTAGAAIVEVVTQKGIEVQLGVEAEVVRLLHVGQSVEISAVLDNSATDVKGTVRLVSESLDLQTRLADVYVELPGDCQLLLGQYVRATAAVDVKDGLIVPRQSVLPNGKTSLVYSIQNGRAVRHDVEVGIDNGTEIQIRSTKLKAGMSVITVGSAQLTDGMRVTIAGETQ
jgi:membrane fusion protein (multidrug efflux system)